MAVKRVVIADQMQVTVSTCTVRMVAWIYTAYMKHTVFHAAAGCCGMSDSAERHGADGHNAMA